MRKALALILVAALGVAMIAGVIGLPPPGSPDTPVQTHVSARYIDGGHEAAGAHNLVTGVLLNYRAIDTFGEVTVIFTALIAVLAAAASGRRANSATFDRDRRSARVPVSPVVSFVVRLMAPFIAVFALFVMLKGHESPGGGFQGGVVLGAMLILLAMFSGRSDRAGDRTVSPGVLGGLRAAGPLVFGAVALIGVAASGWMF